MKPADSIVLKPGLAALLKTSCVEPDLLNGYVKIAVTIQAPYF
jgi:hypothetical protein